MKKTFKRDLFASCSLLCFGVRLRDPSGDAAHMAELIERAEGRK